jgi:hypothetical protein
VVQAAEKQLKYFRKVNGSKRQKLIKKKSEFECLEKDPLRLVFQMQHVAKNTLLKAK